MPRKNLSKTEQRLLNEYGIPPANYGRKPYNENALIKEFVKGYEKGLYKSFSDGARKLVHKVKALANVDTATHIDRLRRKFSAGWKQYKAGKEVTVK